MAPPRSSLQSGLDKEVAQIFRKFQDEQPKDASPLPSASALYQYIQASNSTLKRKPKQILFNSILRVLAVFTDDQNASSDGEMGPIHVDLDNLTVNNMADRSPNIMNKSITSAWGPSSGTVTPNTAAATESASAETKKRDPTRQANGEPVRKKQRKAEAQVDRSPPTSVRLQDLGGVDDVIETLGRHLILPLLMPEEYVRRKISIPRGILLHGPPGCGKTVISRAYAAELGVAFIEIQGPSIVSGMSGESEQKVRDVFEEARRLAPSLLFIDEIDVIAPKRESSQSQMEKRIVAQLMISMDSLAMDQNDGKPTIVLAATNIPDSIDPGLRRGGRFGTEINMGVPNEAMREQILKALTRETPMSADVDFGILAKRTPGFVGADLRDLVDTAGEWSMGQFTRALKIQAADTKKTDEQQETETDSRPSPAILSIQRLIRRAKNKDAERPSDLKASDLTMEAFLEVLPKIQPSSKREGFATIPDTTWSDIGALQDVRETLEMAVVQPIQNPQRYKNVGISAPTGVLLFGPPGCGKTLLAKAVARESKANFISVKGPELLNKVC